MSNTMNYTKSSPSSLWQIEHNLDCSPVCDIIVDLGGGVVRKIHPDAIRYIDENHLEIDFNTPYSGWARLIGKFTPASIIAPGSIDPGAYHAIPAPPSSGSTFTMLSGHNTTFFDEYEAHFGGASYTMFSDTFNASFVPATATLDSTTEATFTDIGSVIGTFSSDADPLYNIWEFTIGEIPAGKLAFIGYFPDDYSFNEDLPNGGINWATTYRSDGVAAYGPNESTFESYTEGDVIGFIYNGYDADLAFFKNGVYQGSKSFDNEGGPLGRAMAGLAEAPVPPALTLRSLSSEMDFWSEYNTFMSGSQLGGSFDDVDGSGNANINGKEVTFNSPFDTFSARGDTSMGSGVKIWEYLISGTPALVSRIIRVGYWVQAFGPPFSETSANDTFGGFYGSDGYMAGYGNSDTVATFTDGDVIGVIYDEGNARLYFFKNGTQVGAGMQVVNPGGYAFAALTS